MNAFVLFLVTIFSSFLKYKILSESKIKSLELSVTNTLSSALKI